MNGTGDEQEWDFFISYSSADQAAAIELYDALSGEARVFLDVRCLRPGDNWRTMLRAAVRKSRAVLVLVSPNLETAHYAQSEIGVAIDLLRSRPGEYRVVPILLDNETAIRREELPLGLGELVTVPVKAHGGWAGVARALLRKAAESDSEIVTDATTAFVGETPMGPVRPQLVTSWAEFQKTFGSEAEDLRGLLLYAVRGFFENGGERAEIRRVTGAGASKALVRLATEDAAQQMVVSARWLGAYGNDISVRVRRGSRRGVRITAQWGELTEDFDNMSVGSGPNPLQSKMAAAELIEIGWVRADLGESMPALGEWLLAGGTDGAPPVEDDYDMWSAMDDIGLLCVPDAANPRFSMEERRSLEKSVTVASEWGRCFGLLSGALDSVAPCESSYGAVYAPWIVVAGLREGTVAVPAVGHVAGVIARCDRERGVHRSMEGMEVRGVADAGALAPGLDEECRRRGINAICVERAGSSRVVVGPGVTMAVEDEWQAVRVRRSCNLLARAVRMGLAWTVFEPDDERTREEVRGQIAGFMERLWRQGVLRGRTAAEAYSVRCFEDFEGDGLMRVEVGAAFAEDGRRMNVVAALPTAAGGR